jgi:hypothetical protein
MVNRIWRIASQLRCVGGSSKVLFDCVDAMRRLTSPAEHLGLIRPQKCEGRNDPVTSFMRPAPVPNDDEIGMPEDNAVADPLSDSTLNLWNDTARTNREIFTEIFRPVPTNLVRDWNAYEVRGRRYGECVSMFDWSSRNTCRR